MHDRTPPPKGRYVLGEVWPPGRCTPSSLGAHPFYSPVSPLGSCATAPALRLPGASARGTRASSQTANEFLRVWRRQQHRHRSEYSDSVTRVELAALGLDSPIRRPAEAECAPRLVPV